VKCTRQLLEYLQFCERAHGGGLGAAARNAYE